MQINIGGFVIQDNAVGDLNPNANAITFDSAAAAPNGFALPANASVRRIKGKVEIAFAGTVVQFLPPGAVSLVLTDLVASTAAGAGNQQLEISFEHQFAGVAAPVKVGDAILGRFVDGANAWMNGSSLQWSAFVNGQRIQPPNVPLNVMNGPGAPAIVPVNHTGGPMVINAGGPPWTLKGELIVQLALPGHTLELPNSAEIGVGPLESPRQQEQQAPPRRDR